MTQRLLTPAEFRVQVLALAARIETCPEYELAEIAKQLRHLCREMNLDGEKLTGDPRLHTPTQREN